MSKINHVAAAIRDDLPEGGALDRAIDLARRSGARLSLFVFSYDKALELYPRTAGREERDRAIADHLEQRREWLRSRAAPLESEGMKVHTEVIWGTPVSREIIKMSLSTQPDLLVKDAETGPRQGWAPLDWNLLRHCPSPLWLVQPRKAPELRRILAAIDPAHGWGKPETLDGVVLDKAGFLAGLYGAQLHVGNAIEPMPALLEQHIGDGDRSALDKARAEFRAEQEKLLNQALEGRDIDTAHVHQAEGAPATVIAGFAEDTGADLLVLGTLNRRGLKRAVIGSTAEAVLDRVPCDVLALKPDGFVSDLQSLLDD